MSRNAQATASRLPVHNDNVLTEREKVCLRSMSTGATRRQAHLQQPLPISFGYHP
jgi:DNA-binding CsgD family transcriptional regulator